MDHSVKLSRDRESARVAENWLESQVQSQESRSKDSAVYWVRTYHEGKRAP